MVSGAAGPGALGRAAAIRARSIRRTSVIRSDQGRGYPRKGAIHRRDVESRMGAGSLDLWPSPRFPSPLIKPDVPISGIRLSDWLHRAARNGQFGAGVEGQHAEFSMNHIESELTIAAPLELVPSREELRTCSMTYWSTLRMPCSATRSHSSWTSLAVTCPALRTSGHGSILLGTRRSLTLS